MRDELANHEALVISLKQSLATSDCEKLEQNAKNAEAMKQIKENDKLIGTLSQEKADALTHLEAANQAINKLEKRKTQTTRRLDC